MTESLWKWIGAVLALLVVLQLTALSAAASPPMNRHDNNNALNEVAPPSPANHRARRIPRLVQSNGIFEFFGALNSIKSIVGDVSREFKSK